MYSHVPRRFSLRIGFAFVISVALLAPRNIPLLVFGELRDKTERPIQKESRDPANRKVCCPI